MASNRKLTAVIRGRTVTRVESRGTTALVTFDDGSNMTVRVVPGWSPPAVTGRVVKARQEETRLQLDLDGGRTLELAIAEPTASVLLRGPDGVLQYAD